jgi:ABC-type glycerol-3-phosphate transport system substrate-binding protein
MSERKVSRSLTRRRFLQSTAGAAGLFAASGFLNGCAPATTGTTAAQPEAAAGAAGSVKEVYVTTPAAFADMGMRDSTDIINDESVANGVRYVLEERADGWEPKVLGMIQDGNVRWSANGIADAGRQWMYIQQGMVQPLDDLLQSSSIEWGRDMANQYMYPHIYEATQFEGKTYYIPMKLNIHLMGYRQDYLEKAGYETIPETWDEFEVMLERMKPVLAEEDVIPFAARKEVFRTLGTAFTTFVENPYDEENMLRINSEEWLALIKMFKGWFDKGYTDLRVLQDPVADWQAGKVAIGMDSHSWIRIGRSVWGAENVKGVVPPRTDAANPKRTWVHLDSGFVFTGAPDPQEGLDWLLRVLGPDGEAADRYWAGTLTFSGMPVHQGQYDRLIGNSTDFPELVEAYQAVENSVLQPMAAGKFYPIIQAKIWPWLERYWGGEIEAEVAMQNVMDEVEQELEKQQAAAEALLV